MPTVGAEDDGAHTDIVTVWKARGCGGRTIESCSTQSFGDFHRPRLNVLHEDRKHAPLVHYLDKSSANLAPDREYGSRLERDKLGFRSAKFGPWSRA